MRGKRGGEERRREVRKEFLHFPWSLEVEEWSPPSSILEYRSLKEG